MDAQIYTPDFRISPGCDSSNDLNTSKGSFRGINPHSSCTVTCNHTRSDQLRIAEPPARQDLRTPPVGLQFVPVFGYACLGELSIRSHRPYEPSQLRGVIGQMLIKVSARPCVHVGGYAGNRGRCQLKGWGFHRQRSLHTLPYILCGLELRDAPFCIGGVWVWPPM